MENPMGDCKHCESDDLAMPGLEMIYFEKPKFPVTLESLKKILCLFKGSSKYLLHGKPMEFLCLAAFDRLIYNFLALLNQNFENPILEEKKVKRIQKLFFEWLGEDLTAYLNLIPNKDIEEIQIPVRYSADWFEMYLGYRKNSKDFSVSSMDHILSELSCQVYLNFQNETDYANKVIPTRFGLEYLSELDNRKGAIYRWDCGIQDCMKILLSGETDMISNFCLQAWNYLLVVLDKIASWSFLIDEIVYRLAKDKTNMNVWSLLPEEICREIGQFFVGNEEPYELPVRFSREWFQRFVSKRITNESKSQFDSIETFDLEMLQNHIIKVRHLGKSNLFEYRTVNQFFISKCNLTTPRFLVYYCVAFPNVAWNLSLKK